MPLLEAGDLFRMERVKSEHDALPPETLEGWYALHQVFTLDRAALRALAPASRAALVDEFTSTWKDIVVPASDGWSAVAALVGSTADVMFVHFRPTLDALGHVQRAVAVASLTDFLTPAYSFLSVTEAGMYHLTARLGREARDRGGKVGDEQYVAEMQRRLVAERESPFVKKRLYPEPPPDMPYVCFYPMSKKRETGQNWYVLPMEERSRLMYAHGGTGRRYAGKVLQIITGAVGFDAWEWGVTLFARDPLDFKKLVGEMRFDEASSKYADFGAFYVGKLAEAGDWAREALPGVQG